jgi:hypothetical protein
VPHEVDAACGIAHQVDELARRHAARRSAGEVVTELPPTLAGEGDALRMRYLVGPRSEPRRRLCQVASCGS